MTPMSFLTLVPVWFAAMPGPATIQNVAERDRCFQITVVDDQTGRGVPLVQLKTTNELRYVTDSNGIVALDEPGLMGQEVYFHVRSHGYEYPKDGFGFRGARLKVTSGGSAVLKIKRINVAERLYRVTGEGTYRDSVLVGRPAPIKHPLLNGQVLGQDSVHATPYRGKLFWIWGDTNRLSYPLGNFAVSGATSELPGRGGLDPSVGVDLEYFVDESGFSRPMIPSDAIPGPGPKWLGGLTTVRDETGIERLVAKYVRVKSLGETLERGLVVFNDETQSFERLVEFDLDAPLYLDGHPFRVSAPLSAPGRGAGGEGSAEYLYCGYSPPYAVRVRADMKHIADPAAHEGFTCLVAGTRYNKAKTELDRGPDGRLIYAWKRNTPPLSYEQQQELIAAGKMKRDEAWLQFEDIETGKPIKPHAGSVCWNDYRKRWVMIVEEAGGTSLLGEVWYAEADTPVGPWVYARKIVTHDKYSFYNPTQHPFFDQDGGRLIYFDGTYSDLFSGSPDKTPRYDYNQIMYRLALDDSRLAVPAPVYRVRADESTHLYLMREGVEESGTNAWDDIKQVPFFAVSPASPHSGLIPIYEVAEQSGLVLRRTPARGHQYKYASRPLFYALPPEPAADEQSSPAVVPLYEYRRANGRVVVYCTDSELADPKLIRSAGSICRVWRNPISRLILDAHARPSTAE
jgi:hypothetical protein